MVLLALAKNNDGRFLLLKLNSDDSGLAFNMAHGNKGILFSRGISNCLNLRISFSHP